MNLFELSELLDFIGFQTYESIYDFGINHFIERALQINRDMATPNQHYFPRYLDNCQERAVQNVIVQDADTIIVGEDSPMLVTWTDTFVAKVISKEIATSACQQEVVPEDVFFDCYTQPPHLM